MFSVKYKIIYFNIDCHKLGEMIPVERRVYNLHISLNRDQNQIPVRNDQTSSDKVVVGEYVAESQAPTLFHPNRIIVERNLEIVWYQGEETSHEVYGGLADRTDNKCLIAKRFPEQSRWNHGVQKHSDDAENND